MPLLAYANKEWRAKEALRAAKMKIGASSVAAILVWQHSWLKYLFSSGLINRSKSHGTRFFAQWAGSGIVVHSYTGVVLGAVIFFHCTELTSAGDCKIEDCPQYGSQIWHPKICWCCRPDCIIRHMADFAIDPWKPWLALFLLSLAFVMVCCERCGDRTDGLDCCVLLLLHRNQSETHSTS